MHAGELPGATATGRDASNVRPCVKLARADAVPAGSLQCANEADVHPTGTHPLGDLPPRYRWDNETARFPKDPVMQSWTSLVHGTGVDEAYGLIHRGCGGSVLRICVSKAPHDIRMTAFRERYFVPAETAERSLTEATWARLKQLVDSGRFWEMPERYDQSGLDGFEWRIEGQNRKGYHSSQCWSPSRGPFYELGMLLVEFSGLEIPHDYREASLRHVLWQPRCCTTTRAKRHPRPGAAIPTVLGLRLKPNVTDPKSRWPSECRPKSGARPRGLQPRLGRNSGPRTYAAPRRVFALWIGPGWLIDQFTKQQPGSAPSPSRCAQRRGGLFAYKRRAFQELDTTRSVTASPRF